MRRVLTQGLVVLLLAAGLGAAPVGKNNSGSKVASRTRQATPYQIGRASWYGKQFDGRSTASGEPYDMFQLTAAHRQLPLGTEVKVTNLHNGRWVVVRVNDRGPVVPGRIIDLSYAAAQMLQFREKGLQKVRLDVVHAPDVVATLGSAASGME